MSERINPEIGKNLTASDIALPGFIRRLELRFLARMAERITPGTYGGNSTTTAKVEASGLGRKIEVWEKPNHSTSHHTTIEIAADDLGVMTPCVSARRDITYNADGQEWPGFRETFDANPGSANSLSLYSVFHSLIAVQGLEEIPTQQV